VLKDTGVFVLWARFMAFETRKRPKVTAFYKVGLYLSQQVAFFMLPAVG